jgi:hypothetical protein
MYSNSEVRRVESGVSAEARAIYSFFNTVYAWMCVGLGVTALVAYTVSRNTELVMMLNSRGIIVALALGAWLIAVGVQSAALRISAIAATLLFVLYAAVLGALLSYLFLIYSMGTLAGAFVMTAGTFGIMSAYGFITKRDLSTVGSILVMVVVGLFLASLVNIFLASTALSWIITYVVLGAFIVLTASHTQQLKMIAVQTADHPDAASRYAIIGSLVLYVAFINMFMSILRIMGSRK